jgi:hypothetical protein
MLWRSFRDLFQKTKVNISITFIFQESRLLNCLLHAIE